MIIDQLPLLGGDVQSTDELPIERGTTSYKTTQAAIVKSATDAAAAAQTTANAAQSAADAAQQTADGKADLITASGLLKGDGTGAVSAATKGTDYAAMSFAATLLASGWSNGTQTISNANFLASGYAYIVSPASGSFTAYGEAQIYADDVTANGSMTFHCGTAPTTNLTVNIVRVVSA